MALALEPPYVAGLVVGGIACVTDVARRRIPNWLTFGAMAAGVIAAVVTGGWRAIPASLAGIAIGFAVFLPFFLLRGMGAGDVKLMAALGAWLGPSDTVYVALYAMIAGGVAALAVALARGYLTSALVNLSSMLAQWRAGRLGPVDGVTLDDARGPRLPYALPIAAGLLVQLWLR